MESNNMKELERLRKRKIEKTINHSQKTPKIRSIGCSLWSTVCSLWSFELMVSAKSVLTPKLLKINIS